MKTFSDRLNAAMQLAGVSQGQVAEAVGISQPAVQKMVSGKTLASKKAVQIAAFLGVRPEWLASGVGDMRRDGDQPMVYSPLHDRDSFRVEILDLTVSAGPGTYMLSEAVEVLNAIEFTNEHAKLLFGNRHAKDIKVMTVDGDSMYPTITSGDRLFFDVSVREFKTDGIYAFVYGKTFHVKRLQMQGLQLAVLSDNPKLEKWYISEETEDQFYVMGKALLQESIQYNKL